MKARIESLDFLRGLAILFTIQGHWIGYSDHPGEWVRLMSRVVPNGYFGVRLFFLISGYIITLIFLHEFRKKKCIDIPFFFIKRALRILPVYALFLVAIFFLNPYLNLGLTANDFLFPSFFLVCFYHKLNWVVLHFWSLNVEEWFYIAFPFVLSLSFKRLGKIKFAKAFPWLLIAVTLLGYVYSMAIESSEKFLLRNLVYLAVGVLFAFKNDFILSKMSKMNTVLTFTFGIALMVVYAVFNPHFVDFFDKSPVTDITTLMANTVVFLLIGFQKNGLHAKVFQSILGRIVAYLGTACYSLYVWQEVFLREGASWPNLFPYNILLVFIVGLASFELVEKRFERWKKKLVIRRNSQ